MRIRGFTAAPSSLVQVEEVEENIRVLRSIFTISAASNTNYKREIANIKGHDFLRPDSHPSLVDSANSCVPTQRFASEGDYLLRV